MDAEDSVKPGRVDIQPLVTHRFQLDDIENAYDLFANRRGGVLKVAGYFLQRMKTKWGSCNTRAGNIRLNTKLNKKPNSMNCHSRLRRGTTESGIDVS